MPTQNAQRHRVRPLEQVRDGADREQRRPPPARPRCLRLRELVGQQEQQQPDDHGHDVAGHRHPQRPDAVRASPVDPRVHERDQREQLQHARERGERGDRPDGARVQSRRRSGGGIGVRRRGHVGQRDDRGAPRRRRVGPATLPAAMRRRRDAAGAAPRRARRPAVGRTRGAASGRGSPRGSSRRSASSITSRSMPMPSPPVRRHARTRARGRSRGRRRRPRGRRPPWPAPRPRTRRAARPGRSARCRRCTARSPATISSKRST